MHTCRNRHIYLCMNSAVQTKHTISIFLMQKLTYRSCKQAEKNQSQHSFSGHACILSSGGAMLRAP